jgi:hypothetical protein
MAGVLRMFGMLALKFQQQGSQPQPPALIPVQGFQQSFRGRGHESQVGAHLGAPVNPLSSIPCTLVKSKPYQMQVGNPSGRAPG